MHARCPLSSSKACRCGRYACHMDSLIVAVDGACPGNGTDAAVTSACGVFFGDYIDEYDNGQENLAWRVADEPSVAHTSQRAELHAAIGSLRAAAIYAQDGGQWPCEVPNHCHSPCPITQLIIKSDSAYLVNGITGSIEKWASNGWKTSKKTPVKNRDLWESLLDELAEYKALGVSVGFWHVPRGENTEADRLANLGLLSDSTVPTPTDLDYE